MSVSRRTLLHQATVAALAAPMLLPDSALAARRRAVHHVRHHARPKPMIVIDPGHGGKDPGCIGLHGTEEKSVVLALGLQLRHDLLASGRYHVAMTRSTDVFIPLSRRVAFAREKHAALFISLHANSARSHHVAGACVYRFAFRPSDAHAAAMARWENSADRFDVKFQGASGAVAHILASLMQKETWLHSAKLQRCLVDKLDDRVKMVAAASRHARFVVLSAPDVASALVETGFLTNPRDEAALRSRSHRATLARAMRLAVDRYFA